MSKNIDIGSLIIAIITLVLFVAALFLKGLTHDLFLEAGVFLVSVKIIVMTYKNGVAVGRGGEAQCDHHGALNEEQPPCRHPRRFHGAIE